MLMRVNVTQMDLDDLNVDNAYFRSFDVLVRRQLDPVWHKVGPKTKQLVSDLATLRRLLMYVCSLFFSHAISSLGSRRIQIPVDIRRSLFPRVFGDAYRVKYRERGW